MLLISITQRKRQINAQVMQSHIVRSGKVFEEIEKCRENMVKHLGPQLRKSVARLGRFLCSFTTLQVTTNAYPLALSHQLRAAIFGRR